MSTFVITRVAPRCRPGDEGEIRLEIRGEADEVRGEIHGDVVRVHLSIPTVGREFTRPGHSSIGDWNVLWSRWDRVLLTLS